MGVCANTPPSEAEIKYDSVDQNKDVAHDNAMDPTGEKIIDGLYKTFTQGDKIH